MIQYEGTLYRPPSEAHSLIVQATIGCSNNICAFCSMYKEKKFRIRPIDEIIEDFRRARDFYSYIERIFIADGDALIMSVEHWKRILGYISEYFPECKRVTCYATPKSVLLKTEEQLKYLKEHGLEMVYMGLESGSDRVLELMKKGNTSEMIIRAAKKLHSAGIKISVTAINGLGGREYFMEHAVNTGKVLSKMKPEYIGLLTPMIEPYTPLYEKVKNKEFIPLNSEEILQEIGIILQHCDCPGSVFRGNHASNYLPLRGTLNEDKEMLLSQIEWALEGKIDLCPEWMRRL